MICVDANPEAYSRTFAAIDEGIQSGVAPEMVAGVWDGRRPDEFLSFGDSKRIFDLASLTKVIATAPLAARLVERGWLSWNTPVSAFFSDYPYKEIQIRHLLSHTAGLPAWRPFYESIQKEFAPKKLWRIPVKKRVRAMRDLVLAVPPNHPPGKEALYSDLTFLILGFILEEVTQMPLDQAVRSQIWNPLGLKNTFYLHVLRKPAAGTRTGIAPTEESEWRGGLMQGQVHDDNCWAMGGVAGHAGAFGTVEDLMRFVRGLFDRFLGYETLQKMWTRVSEPQGCERTLGWDTPSGEKSSAGKHFSSHSVGHLGFTGTSLWIDLEASIAVALLTNRVHPTRDNVKIRAFRPRFHDVIREELKANS